MENRSTLYTKVVIQVHVHCSTYFLLSINCGTSFNQTFDYFVEAIITGNVKCTSTFLWNMVPGNNILMHIQLPFAACSWPKVSWFEDIQSEILKCDNYYKPLNIETPGKWQLNCFWTMKVIFVQIEEKKDSSWFLCTYVNTIRVIFLGSSPTYWSGDARIINWQTH